MNTDDTTTRNRVRRQRRARLAAVIPAIAIAAAPLTAVQTAHAAPGDFTIAIESPGTVDVNQQFTETIIVDCPEGSCSGIVIRQQLPAELRLVNVSTGPTARVASVSGGTGLGALLEFTLNDIVTGGAATFAVGLVNDFSASTTVSPSSSWDLVITSGEPDSPDFQSATSTTKPQGTIPMQLAKRLEVVPGSDNRRVTYSFDSILLAPRVGRFAARALQFVDVIPEHAEVVDHSPGGLPGSWTSTPGPGTSTTWTFTGTGSFAPPAPTTNLTVPAPRLVVHYPEPHFAAGTRPPVNSVALTAEYRDGTRSAAVNATAQGPTLGSGTGPSTFVGAEKVRTTTGSRAINTYGNTLRMRGSVLDSAGNGVRSFTLTDDSNATFFDHAVVSNFALSFSPELAAAAAPWEFQLSYSHTAGWHTVKTGTTAAGSDVCPRVAGSTPVNVACKIADRPNGSAITGWRLVISPGASDPLVPNFSVATVNMTFAPLWRSVSTGADLAGGTLSNTLVVSGNNVTAGEPLTPVSREARLTITDAVYTSLDVSTQSTLVVGAADHYVHVYFSPQHDQPVEGCVAAVLPLGTRWDGSPLTNLAQQAPPGQVAPGIESVSLHGQTPEGHDIVMVCFDGPFAPTVDGDIPTGHTSAVSFRIPIVVVPSAYRPPASDSVPARVYAVVASPTTAQVGGPFQFISSDRYNLDPLRDSVNYDTASTTILSDGDLQLEKLVSVDGGANWSLVGETSSPSTDVIWRVGFYNLLPTGTAGEVAFCDWLPHTSDGRGSEFALELSAAVTGAPAGAVVEYARTEAGCSEPGISWSTSWQGANTFRVFVPTVETGSSVLVDARTHIPGGLPAFSVATNSAIGAASVGEQRFEDLMSNSARISILPNPAFTLTKKTNGEAYEATPGARVTTGSTVTWTFEITNTGNTPLEGFAITDVFTDGSGATGTVTVDTAGAPRLLPGDTATFRSSGTAVEGQYGNTATATAIAVSDDGDVLNEQPGEQVARSWYLAEAGATPPVIDPPIRTGAPNALATLGNGSGALLGSIAALLLLSGAVAVIANRRRARRGA